MKLDQALAIVDAAFRHGKDTGCKPLTLAVLDAGGHLILLHRQDGSSYMRSKIAIGKANGALSLGISSRKIAEMAAERPQFVQSLSGLAVGGLIPAAGGLLVTDQAGVLLGAVGITGDTSDNDEACAQAGILSAGLSIKP